MRYWRARSDAFFQLVVIGQARLLAMCSTLGLDPRYQGQAPLWFVDVGPQNPTALGTGANGIIGAAQRSAWGKAFFQFLPFPNNS